jgi:hypothetical protein
MVFIDFVAKNLELLVNIDEEDDERVVLLAALALKGRQSVQLTTEEDFTKFEGNLRLIEETSEESQDECPIGWMTYCAESSGIDYHSNATYQLDVRVPTRRFRALGETANQGRMPSLISVEIGDTKGMKRDWQPDGSGKIWDNKNFPQLPIKSIFFITPLNGGDPKDVLDDGMPEDGMPPSRASVNQVTSLLKQVNNKLSWLMISVLILFAVVIWRY